MVLFQPKAYNLAVLGFKTWNSISDWDRQILNGATKNSWTVVTFHRLGGSFDLFMRNHEYNTCGLTKSSRKLILE